jgi:ABC-type uncharacterized transport system substrate-binding protein
MREHGYVDGQNVTFVERWAEGRSERFPEIIKELISLKANVVLVVSAPAALAAKSGEMVKAGLCALTACPHLPPSSLSRRKDEPKH